MKLRLTTFLDSPKKFDPYQMFVELELRRAVYSQEPQQGPGTTQHGLLGTAATDACPVDPPPSGGVWEEIVSGPDADGFYTIERKLLAPPTSLERNQHIADYIKTHQDDPDAVTVRAVASATGIPPASVARSASWRAFAAWRDSGKVGELRTQALTDAMLACITNRTDEKNVLEELIATQQLEGADDYYPPEQV